MYEFDYHKPSKLDDAAALAARDEFKLLAGGMSLIPAMKLRLARYSGIVDLGALPDLKSIRREAHALVIGSMTPHAAVAASAEVAKAIPALVTLAGGIGDPLVRNRGTIGGSLANADPGADYPAGVLGLDATIRTNRRDIPSTEFFRGLFETALSPGEIITTVSFPIPERAAYAKLRQQASRFAIVGVFVAKTASGARVGVTGAGPHAFRWKDAEAALDRRFEAGALDKLELDASGLNSDIHASAEYRANAVRVMAQRAVKQCL